MITKQNVLYTFFGTRLLVLTLRSLPAMMICSLLVGCSSMRIEDFADSKPVFVPQEYFSGPMTAYGVIKNRSGKVASRFKGTMFGSWDDDGVGTLNEFFVYSNGDTQKRVWTFKPKGDGTFIGTANDIVGEAPIVVCGNTMMIDYKMRIPRGKGSVNIDVKDWLHLQEDGVIINHSKMRLFGFRVGELVITIIKDFPPS